MGKTGKAAPTKDMNTPAITAAMMAINPVASKGWLDIMSETGRFMMDRLQQDLKAQQAILACKTSAELMQVQSEFYTSAMEQYSKEFTRLCKMMSTATNDTLNDARSGHSRSYEDIPL